MMTTYSARLAAFCSAVLITMTAAAPAFALTGPQVAQYAHSNTYNEDFSGPDLVTAVAIAGAESGWDSTDVGDAGTSFGLWQVHTSVWTAYSSNELTSDPNYAAHAAYEIRNSTLGWHNWTTYSQFTVSNGHTILTPGTDGSGAFTAWISVARAAASSVDSTVIQGIGDRIQATATLDVRDSAGGNLIPQYQQNTNAAGTIIDGRTDATYLAEPAGASRYYLWWKVQWDNGAVGWSAEDYMLRTATSVASQPDLAMQNVSAPSKTYAPGASVAVTSTVANVGGLASSGYTVSYYASTDAIITSNDYAIGSAVYGSLAGGASATTTAYGNLPSSLPDGSYYIGAIVSSASDANANNNVACSSQTITVSAASSCTYVLNPTGASVPASGGDVNFAVTTGNACQWAAIPGPDWITISSNPQGPGSKTVTVFASSNAGTSPRAGTISVGDQTFTLTQAGQAVPPPAPTPTPSGAVLGLSTDEFDLSSGSGSGNFLVYNLGPGTLTWGAGSNVSWLYLPETTGSAQSGGTSFVFNIYQNNTGSLRTGTITFTSSGAGGSPQVLPVNQYPSAPPVVVSNVSVSPSSTAAGTNITISCSVASPVGQYILFGASIYPTGQTNESYNDASDDQYITVAPGTQFESRSFLVPSNVPSGQYDVQVAFSYGSALLGSSTMVGAVSISAVIAQPTPAPAPAPAVSAVTKSGSNIKLTVQTLTGHTYQLQQTTSLNPAAWQNVGSSQTGSGAAIDFSASAQGAAQFYRIMISPWP